VSTQIEKDTLRQDPAGPSARNAPATPLSDKVRSLRISQPKHRGGSGAVVPWIFCVLFAGASGYMAYLLYIAPRQAADERVADAAATKSAESAAQRPPAAADGNLVVLESKGYIVPTHKILLSPKVNGMVKYLRIQEAGKPPRDGVPLEEGMRVKQGDILAQLESTDYEADVARARAMLASAEFKFDMERMNLPQ
jgi:multidrug efflux pump subunit AcrA (membrane-fusion protein)